MGENEKTAEGQEQESIPNGQVWFDRIFFWLALGLLISILMFNGWGLLELFG